MRTRLQTVNTRCHMLLESVVLFQEHLPVLAIKDKPFGSLAVVRYSMQTLPRLISLDPHNDIS